MKKPLILLFSCIFSFCINAQITNPSFEEWYFKDIAHIQRWEPVGWIVNDPAGFNFSQSSDAVDGLTSFMRTCDKGCITQLEYNGHESQYIEPFYHIALWVKFEGFANAEKFEVVPYIQITYKDESNNYCYCRIDSEDRVEVKGSGWQRVTFPLDCDCYLQDSVTFLSCVMRFAARVNWGDAGPGTIWIDHVQVSSTPFQTPFIKPKAGDHFLTGREDTIKWDVGLAGQKAKLFFSTDNGANYSLLADNISSDTGVYIWDVPDTLLTAKAKLQLTNQTTGDILAESDKFLIKPYVLTRLESNGDMTEYNNLTDPWSFDNNDSADVWPEWYYDQFDYLGFDPLTNLPYDTNFIDALPEDFPGWNSFTDAFSVGKCYDNIMTGIYNQKASTLWKRKRKTWRGSCFGIAASNALAFESKNDFLNNFPDFGAFAQPAFVDPSNGTVATVTELFAHQYGNPTIHNRIAENGIKTPTQTIRDIKKMFSTPHTEIRTLSMYNNSGSGGHNILPYKLEQDKVNEKYYYIYVYDNSYPDIIDARIRVDVSSNGGKGSWEPLYGWSGWGGNRKFFLEVPATYFYVNATLKKATRSYALLDSLIDISPNDGAFIRIKDRNGNTIGYDEGQLFEEISDAHALMLLDGSEAPPYRYLVPSGEYTIDISNPESETAEGYIFTKDQLFYYERKNATPEQTDRLIYNGSLTAINPDDEDRNIKMKLILEEVNEEKVFKLQSFKLEADDSVKVESPDNNHVILSNYGSGKQYKVELDHVSSSGYKRLVQDSIPIKANTSHIFDVNWTDVEESVLTIYVDEEMNGADEDTLRFNQEVTGFQERLNDGIPVKVWPNPTKDKLTFSYTLDKASKVSINIFDTDGKQVLSKMNQLLQASGKQTVPIELSGLPAGIYYYRITINSQTDYGKIIKL